MLMHHQVDQGMTKLFTRFLDELGPHDGFYIEADTTGRVILFYSGPGFSDLPVKAGLVMDDSRVICLTFSEEDSKEWIKEQMRILMDEVKDALKPKNAEVATATN